MDFQLRGHSSKHNLIKLSETEFQCEDDFTRIMYDKDPENIVAVDFEGGPYLHIGGDYGFGIITEFARPNIIRIKDESIFY